MNTHFAFLLLRDFTHLAFSCALEPLRIANMVSGQTLYSWTLVSENGRSETSSNGAVTLVDRGLEPLGRDTGRLFVVAGNNVQRHSTPAYSPNTRFQSARERVGDGFDLFCGFGTASRDGSGVIQAADG